MNGLPASEIARTAEQQEDLAKGWLVRMIQSSSLADAASIPTSWIASEAPALIGGIVRALGEPSGSELPAREATGSLGINLARLRAETRPERVAQELADLHVVLVEEIGLRTSPQRSNELVISLTRLAELFGSIQAEFAGTLAATGPTSAAAVTRPAAPIEKAQLDDWLHALLDGQRRYGCGFALALIEVDGLDRISDAYGPDSAGRVVTAVAGVVGRQVRAADRAFKLSDGEFCVLAPHTRAVGLMPIVERVVELIARAQAADGPRIAITAGVVDCPSDGSTADELLESAHEAGYAAKAAGVPAARIKGPVVALQDR